MEIVDFVQAVLKENGMLKEFVEGLWKEVLKKERKKWFEEIKFNTKESWDFCLTVGLSDDQVTKMRLKFDKKKEGLRLLFRCTRTVGSERRKEFKMIEEKLKMRECDDKEGIYFSVEEVMKWVVELYGKKCDEEEVYKWKVSVDGKSYGSDDVEMVMVGLTPLMFC